MKKQLTIEFPLPPREVSANARPAWRRKAAAVKGYRAVCAMCAVNACAGVIRPIPTLATMHLHFYLGPSRQKGLYRPRDSDNARYSAKALQDGIVDSCVLRGDSAKYLKMGDTLLLTTKEFHKGKAAVVAILEWDES